MTINIAGAQFKVTGISDGKFDLQKVSPPMADTKKSQETEEKEETSEEVLARLEVLSSRLSIVSESDGSSQPELEVIQSHPVLEDLLYINGNPHPNIWIPDYHSMQRERGKYAGEICSQGSPVEGYRCTQLKELCDGGYMHMAGYNVGDYATHQQTRYDMILEMWGGAEAQSPGLLVQGVHYDRAARTPHKGYEAWTINAGTYEGGCEAKSPGPNPYSCSMPANHYYSHIACGASVMLEVWPL